MSTTGQQGNLSARLVGTQYDTSLLNQLLQQQSAAQRAEASLHQRSLLQSLLPSPRPNNMLAVALQQELAAASSLSSSNLQLLSNANRGSQGNLVGGGGLLARQEQELAMLRRITGSNNSTNSNPSLVQSMATRGDVETSVVDGQKESSFVESAVQLPCQARGMAADHNSSTAFFEIPSDATHGQHLLCSHPACRAAGVKFRYCLVCKKPVTKQNFRSRHLHADMEKTKSSNSGVIGDGEMKAPTPRKRLPKKRPASDISTVLSQKSATVPKSSRPKIAMQVEPDIIVPDTMPNPCVKDEVQQKIDENPIISTAQVVKSPDANSVPAVDDALRIVLRKRRWTSLLSERPSSFQNMDSWISDVIAVSDNSIAFELKASSLHDGAVSSKISVDQLSNWNALLGQRPVSKHGESVTSWLTKVLAASCPSNNKSRPALSLPGAVAAANTRMPPKGFGRLLKKMKHSDFDKAIE